MFLMKHNTSKLYIAIKVKNFNFLKTDVQYSRLFSPLIARSILFVFLVPLQSQLSHPIELYLPN